MRYGGGLARVFIGGEEHAFVETLDMKFCKFLSLCAFLGVVSFFFTTYSLSLLVSMIPFSHYTH